VPAPGGCRCPGNPPGKTATIHLDTSARVGEALENRQVAPTYAPGELAHGHELAREVLDAPRVERTPGGEAVTGPNPTLEGGPFGAGQHKR